VDADGESYFWRALKYTVTLVLGMWCDTAPSPNALERLGTQDGVPIVLAPSWRYKSELPTSSATRPHLTQRSYVQNIDNKYHSQPYTA
jgi:hypothetical protein